MARTLAGITVTEMVYSACFFFTSLSGVMSGPCWSRETSHAPPTFSSEMSSRFDTRLPWSSCFVRTRIVDDVRALIGHAEDPEADGVGDHLEAGVRHVETLLERPVVCAVKFGRRHLFDLFEGVLPHALDHALLVGDRRGLFRLGDPAALDVGERFGLDEFCRRRPVPFQRVVEVTEDDGHRRVVAAGLSFYRWLGTGDGGRRYKRGNKGQGGGPGAAEKRIGHGLGKVT